LFFLDLLGRSAAAVTFLYQDKKVTKNLHKVNHQR
jgi:hypothetical protein